MSPLNFLNKQKHHAKLHKSFSNESKLDSYEEACARQKRSKHVKGNNKPKTHQSPTADMSYVSDYDAPKTHNDESH